MVPQGDPDLTAYVNKLLRRDKPEQQHNIFLFSKPGEPGKSEVDTSIQAPNHKELFELKQEEKLNPRESTESQKQIPQTI